MNPQSCCMAVLLGVSLSVVGQVKTAPSFEEVRGKLQNGHPRMFLNRNGLPEFRRYISTTCAERVKALRTKVDSYPDKPEFQLNDYYAKMTGDHLVFVRNKGNQNTIEDALKMTFGNESLECAIVYLATGDRKYLRKTVTYLHKCVEFVQLARRSRIMPEWYHYGRLNALIAYDWLYDDLTEKERRDFIVPMMEYIDFMQSPGYQRNNGGPDSGNYGEDGLLWFAGLAAYGDGFVDELAEKLLKRGYQQMVDMMQFREEKSQGTGLLTSITTGYSFGAYPWASYNFIHTLKSAAGLDVTEVWTQMRDYAKFFSWLSIRNTRMSSGFLEYGWGDAFHMSGNIAAGDMYNHMAQLIHLFGKRNPQSAREARAVIELLPESVRKFSGLARHPYLPFILTEFDPEIKNTESPEDVLGKQIAAYFPSYGLMCMRSGYRNSDTYAGIKAGAQAGTHQHFDENSFIIYKKGFQALDSGTRCQMKHHQMYYAQTIAHNAILIRDASEPVARHWYPSNGEPLGELPPMDGGQNCKCQNRALGFDVSDYHAVTGGDATACYSAAKCREAVRQFVYVKPDFFIVYDRVTSVKNDQQKVFLLHTQNLPVKESDAWRSSTGEGGLFMKTLLPANAQTKVIGGPGQEFVAGGVNYPVRENGKILEKEKWFGQYRLEVSPSEAGCQTRFLHLLQATTGKNVALAVNRLIQTATDDGIVFEPEEGVECTVLFHREGLIGGSILIRKNGETVLQRPLLADRKLGEPQSAAQVPFLQHRSARIDLFIKGGDMTIADKGNANSLKRATWLNEGKAFTASFNAGNKMSRGKVAFTATASGTLVCRLMGPDVRVNKKFQKVEVDFIDLKINGKPMLKKAVRVWHNEPLEIQLTVKTGETVTIETAYKMAE